MEEVMSQSGAVALLVMAITALPRSGAKTKLCIVWSYLGTPSPFRPELPLLRHKLFREKSPAAVAHSYQSEAYP